MKSLKVLLLGACVALCACSSPTSTVQTNDKGTQWQWENGTIVVETPQRPADRKSVIGLALPKMEVVRVGFVGLGMRGPGIGLSLVKELVEMHKALITVDSKLGEGSCFKIDFMKGKEQYDESVEFMQDDITVGLEAYHRQTADTEDAQPSQPETGYQEKGGGDASKDLMLLVEDNSELRIFLRSIFASEYRIVEAANGMEGLNKALKFLPDIIISDVMMPEKDGIAMTRELRADMTTSHIPIVLLTAKSSIESKLEGLEYGADDYITKPFSATYLKARVKNLLAQRQKLQTLYRQNLMQAGAVAAVADEQSIGNVQDNPQTDKSAAMSPNDRKFMDKLIELMEKNMDNGDLVVDDFVQELAVSRSVFFKKLKTLTGLAPIEFIKEMPAANELYRLWVPRRASSSCSILKAIGSLISTSPSST